MNQIIVSNTSPLRYLIDINEQNLLPELFEHIFAPNAVYLELTHLNVPEKVRNYVQTQPNWLHICEVSLSKQNKSIWDLDAGETEAIFLAQQKSAMLLIDEKKGRLIAKEQGLSIMGVLGVLMLAARQHKVDLPQAIEKLRQTNMKIAPALFEKVLNTRIFT